MTKAKSGERIGEKMKYDLSDEKYLIKRYKESKRNLLNATERLKEVLQEKENDIVIDGTLHRFEFTFELAWKTMKDYLEYSGIIDGIGIPREIIKTAFANGIIEDGEDWIKMMLERNSLLYLYDEEKSREIYIEIKEVYLNLFEKLNNKFADIL